MELSFIVPPQAHFVLSSVESSLRSIFLSSMPWIIVAYLPKRLLSSVIFTRWDSLTISSQTQRSSGSPHLSQTATILLLLLLDGEDSRDGAPQLADATRVLRRTASRRDRPFLEELVLQVF